MLEQLTIRDFAIIDRLDVRLRSGLNVITGETGAGKSILIDAVGALLGDRLGTEVVRTGAERAVVEGVFQVGDAPPVELRDVLEEFGLETEDGLLVLTREIAAAGGRGGARINGRVVPLTVLEEVGARLVDVHGQHQHMALLRPREQLEYLDRYAGLLAERSRVSDLVRQLRSVREEQATLDAAGRTAAREQDILRYEVQEIEEAGLRVGEEEELTELRERQRHRERLREMLGSARAALLGDDTGESRGVVDGLGLAVSACDAAARVDRRVQEQVEILNGALAQAEDAARDLGRYLDEIEQEPARLEETQERLFALADLRRKYGATIAEVLEYQAQAAERLETLEHRDEHRAELAEQENRLAEEVGDAAAALSRRRTTAAKQLEEQLEEALVDLHMAGTQCVLAVTQEDAPDGVPCGERRLAISATGVDRVEIRIAPNKGETPRPLARIASGGELARIALALATVLSDGDTRPTLIFDEVDSGVGGRTAPVVGEKLRAVGATHQVLCVTHLPQVAAYAGAHFAVAKESDDGRTRTSIRELSEPEQVVELATMLGGAATERARASARELLERARGTG